MDEVLDQGRIPTPDPSALFTSPVRSPQGPLQGTGTDLLLSQRELMMRSILDGSVDASQRAQIQHDYCISGQDLEDFRDVTTSGASGNTTTRPTTGGKQPRRGSGRGSGGSGRGGNGGRGSGRGGNGGRGGGRGGGGGGGGGPPGRGGGGGGGPSPSGGGSTPGGSNLEEADA